MLVSDFLTKVKTISAYTVNSHEIYNKLNAILEQNPGILIREVILLVEKKVNKTPDYIKILEQNVEL